MVKEKELTQLTRLLLRRARSSLALFTRIVAPIAGLSVATVLLAQGIPSSSLPQGGLGQNGTLYQPGQVDCSDPSSPIALCMGRFSASQSLDSGSSVLGGQMGMGTATGLPSPTVTYTDTDGMLSERRMQNLPRPAPEPLTEFQKFIAASTGQVLPIFAVNLFENVPSTFSPLDAAPVPSDYIIGPDDELRIRVWGKLGFSANLRVNRSGEIFLPQVGAIHLAGLPFSELEQHLRDAIARVYRSFDLTVDLGKIRAIQVYVTGVARRPGAYTISSLSTLVDALFASGGPSVQGSMRKVELRRSNAPPLQFDLYGLLIHGEKSNDAKLASGDIIFIPPVGPQVAIYGSVRRPAIYELRKGDTVSDLLKEAGGASAVASDSRVSIERIVNHSARQTVEIALDAAGETTPLAEGDILRVLSVLPEYKKTVTLRGHVANPGRFAWHDGMRLSDLIPDRESLITRDYWWKRAQLGLPALDYEPVPALSAMRQPAAPFDLRRPLPASSALTNQSRANQSIANQSSSQFAASPGSSAYGEQEAPPGALSGAAGYAALPDESQRNANQSAERTANERGSQSALAEHEPETPQFPPPPPRTTVRLNTPEIDWGYAAIERMNPETLKASLIPFDLGKLVIDHDVSQNVELKPGDVVSIFSQADIHVPINQQTKFVKLDGEFVHAGTYSVLPGETLRSLVERAGGLTPNAYLYGSEFTRESTRIIQQRRIDESIQNLTLQMQRGNLALASSPVSTPQDLVGVSAAQTSERELIAQLKQIRATGRIVLEFTPDSTGENILPDIPLENGDGFLVPSLPSTVNVVGAVFNQNSFLYRMSAPTALYLRLAGGPNTSADRKRMFVVRANGEVINRGDIHNAWGDQFDRLRMSPGDTLVVPEKGIKPSALRGVLDWSQIVSQFAFGAAAIDVLR